MEDDALFNKDIRLLLKFNELIMGIKRLKDLKEMIINSIYIYLKDANYIKAFKEIIKKYLALWNNKGLINVLINK